MNLKTQSLIACLTIAGVSSGCAAVAPAQLVEARNAYAVASEGTAAKVTPTELHDAKKVLDNANREFDANGDTVAVRDYSYIALRKIELANAKARTEVDRQKIVAAEKRGIMVRDSQVKSTQAALASSREQLREERTEHQAATTEWKTANTAQQKELESSAALLEAEKQARLTADAKLAGAMRDLATVAAVKEEARGVVITLSGGVLFPSGQYDLLETAKTKLDQVAAALKTQSGDRRMLVEGHTDSQGSNATNQALSLSRANAVRDYLVAAGVGADKLSATGVGASRPLVDNRTSANRANNRRVEIVIPPAPATAP
jgi:outer membrane protein OmpA-like peptidoglycan-associated protein